MFSKVKIRNKKGLARLLLKKSLRNLDVQLIDKDGKVLFYKSTNQEFFLTSKLKGYNEAGASFLGQVCGDLIKEKGYEVVFDCGNLKYAGRVKKFYDKVQEIIGSKK